MCYCHRRCCVREWENTINSYCESNEKSLSKQVWKLTGKIPLFNYIDVSNKIASHKCFVTDSALPGICNNQIPVRQLEQVVGFFPRENSCLFFYSTSLALHPDRSPPLACSALDGVCFPKPSACIWQLGRRGWTIGEAILSRATARVRVPEQNCWVWTLPD